MFRNSADFCSEMGEVRLTFSRIPLRFGQLLLLLLLLLLRAGEGVENTFSFIFIFGRQIVVESTARRSCGI